MKREDEDTDSPEHPALEYEPMYYAPETDEEESADEKNWDDVHNKEYVYSYVFLIFSSLNSIFLVAPRIIDQ